MSFTYNFNPVTSRNDAIRFLIGDTDFTLPLVEDEEIAYALQFFSVDSLVAAKVADALAAKFARQSDKQIGDLKDSLSQKSKAFGDLAKSLRANA